MHACCVIKVKKTTTTERTNFVYYNRCGCYRDHTRGLTCLSSIYVPTGEVVELFISVSLTFVAVGVTVDTFVLYVPDFPCFILTL